MGERLTRTDAVSLLGVLVGATWAWRSARRITTTLDETDAAAARPPHGARAGATARQLASTR